MSAGGLDILEKTQLATIAREALSQFLDVPGAIFYSSHATLQKGDIYLLGFNPGGEDGRPLREAIDGLLTVTENAYIEQNWSGRRNYKPGHAPLQKRVTWLLDALGYVPENICASNLIFMQSKSAASIPYANADVCWPVHRAILDIVRPKLILAFGNSACSPYAYLRDMFGTTQTEEIEAGHGNWKVKGCSITVPGDPPVYLAGLPHLSYYSPIGKSAVVSWLRAKLIDSGSSAATAGYG